MSKFTFLLKNINFQEIDKKYGLTILNEDEEMDIEQKEDVLSIINDFEPLEPVLLEPHQFATRTKVIMEEHKQAQSFYTENIDTVQTLYDYASHGNIPCKTDILCYWCKYSIENSPLGCPVRWINHIVEKNYKSSLTKDGYSLKENVSENKLNEILNNKPDNLIIIPNRKGYFHTDGIFCSFNCVLAFILDNKHNNLYKESISLLYHMYERLIGQPIENMKHTLLPAPHWRLLIIFGGSFTIEEFREKFNHVYYNELFTIDIMKPLSTIFKIVKNS